jgi:hypothetical protein
MVQSMPKPTPVETLRELLREVFRQREEGVPHVRFARALGYADGYMQALIDARIAAERELLALVSEERQRASGPASREVDAASERAVA